MKKYILLHGISIFMVCLTLTGCGKTNTDVFTKAELSTETESLCGTENATGNDLAGTAENGSTEGVDSLVIDGTETSISSVFVYVCGAVNRPDVYELPSGSRICDALSAAGGITDDAAADYWNQAELLTDGEMIYVPTQAEAEERRQTQESSDSSDNSAASSGFSSQEADDGKININTATKEELMTITGIGEGRAESIIKYREANGDFASTEDITNVSGIGDTLYANMKDAIKVK